MKLSINVLLIDALGKMSGYTKLKKYLVIKNSVIIFEGDYK